MRLFAIDSPIDRQRSISLRNVRDTMVEFVTQNTNNHEITMTELQNNLMSNLLQGIRDEDVTHIGIVTTSWNAMLNNVSDPATNQYKNNLKILEKVTYFRLKENQNRILFNRDDTTNYLKVIVGEFEVDDEKKVTDVQTLSENKFSSLLDAISIFITGSDGIPADIPQNIYQIMDQMIWYS